MDQIAVVRRFHRLVTQRAGALEDHFLGRERPLWESRLLYEIGEPGADLRDLRARLDLDSGYLSRLVTSLSDKGLVRVESSVHDERVKRAGLTPAGQAEFDEINRRSDDLARGLLDPLTPKQRTRLVTAMEEVHRLLLAAGIVIVRVDPSSDTALWCLDQYYAELRERFESGFDAAASASPDHEDLVPPKGGFLVAELNGEPIACGAVRKTAPSVGYIKRMWVDRSARGLGLGRRMLEALEDLTRELGCDTVQLETNRALTEAIALYRRSGYHEVAPFNDEFYAHHWFEKRLQPQA